MFDIIETLLIKVFSLLPNADQNDTVIVAVNSAFATITPTFAKLDLIFPVYSLFKILLLALFIEMTLFIVGLIIRVVK